MGIEMRIGVNQFCWPNSYDVEDAIKQSKALGFETFEVCMTLDGRQKTNTGSITDALDISGYHNRLLHCNTSRKEVLKLKEIADAAGIPIGSVGGILTFSIYPLTALEKNTAQKAMDAVKNMMDAAAVLGADTVLVIPGILTDAMDYERAYERVQSRLCKLADYNPFITLAVENVWNHFLYSPLELKRFVDETGRKNIGVYFDIANARTFGYPEQWIRTLAHRIKKLHVKDFRMSIDNISGFTNLLDGDVNYPKVIEALREVNYQGDFIVELIPPASHLVETSLDYAKNTLKELLKEG